MRRGDSENKERRRRTRRLRREGRDVKRRRVKMEERMTRKRKMVREEVVTVTTEERDAGVALETGEEVEAETGEIETTGRVKSVEEAKKERREGAEVLEMEEEREDSLMKI